MPAIQVIDQLNPTQYEGQNALLNTLDEFRARQVAEQDRQGLSRLYQKYQNDRANIDEAIFAAQTERGLSPTARINATNTLMALKKQNDATAIATKKQLDERNAAAATAAKKAAEDKAKADEKAAERKRITESNYELYKNIMSEEEARRRAGIDSEATARTVFNQANKPVKSEPKTEFEKTAEKEEAKELIKLKSEIIPKGRDQLTNISYIRDVFNKNLAKGPYGQALAYLGAGGAAEVDNIGFTVIEPIIKLFNPVGPIPVAKVNIIRSIFQPKSTDPRWVFEAKCNALERIARQGIERAEKPTLGS